MGSDPKSDRTAPKRGGSDRTSDRSAPPNQEITPIQGRTASPRREPLKSSASQQKQDEMLHASRPINFNYALRSSLMLLGLERWQQFVRSVRRYRISGDGEDILPPNLDFLRL